MDDSRKDKNVDNNRFTKKIGKTTYQVTVHFSETSKETLQDKINRLIKNDCPDMGN